MARREGTAAGGARETTSGSDTLRGAVYVTCRGRRRGVRGGGIMTYLLRRARAGCRGRAGRSASLPAAAAVVRAAKQGAWRAARGAAVGRRRRLGSRAAGGRGRRPNRRTRGRRRPGGSSVRRGMPGRRACSAVCPSGRRADRWHGGRVGRGLRVVRHASIAGISADPAAHERARHAGARGRRPSGAEASGLRWVATACHTSGPPGRVLRGTCHSYSRACIISLGQSSG